MFHPQKIGFAPKLKALQNAFRLKTLHNLSGSLKITLIVILA
ncbi:hypothetical protein ACKLNO_05900 [Neisseriaceae bacterium B1]